MKTFNKMLMASVLAITPLQTFASPSLDLSGTGSLDINVEDLDRIKDYGSLWTIRDLEFRADAQLMEWLTVRAIVACNDKKVEEIDDCAQSTRDILKDFTVGVMIPEFGGQKMVVLVGKTELPFGGGITQRSVVTNNPLNQTDRELERKKVIMLQWSPKVQGNSSTAQIINELVSLVEVAAYSSDSGDLKDFKKTDDYKNYALRVSGVLRSLFYQASYLDEKDGERRWGLAAGMPVLDSGFKIYGEYQNYKDNTNNPDLKSATTVGVSKNIKGGTAAVEYSKIKGSDLEGDRVGVSYKHGVGKHVTLGAEVDAEKDGDNAAGYVSVTSHFGQSKNIETRSLFPQIQERVNKQRARMDEMRKK